MCEGMNALHVHAFDKGMPLSLGSAWVFLSINITLYRHVQTNEISANSTVEPLTLKLYLKKRRIVINHAFVHQLLLRNSVITQQL